MNWVNCGCVEQRSVVIAAIHAVAKTYAIRIADGLEPNFPAQAATVFLRHSPVSIRTQLADCSSTPIEGSAIAHPVRKEGRSATTVVLGNSAFMPMKALERTVCKQAQLLASCGNGIRQTALVLFIRDEFKQPREPSFQIIAP